MRLALSRQYERFSLFRGQSAWFDILRETNVTRLFRVRFTQDGSTVPWKRDVPVKAPASTTPSQETKARVTRLLVSVSEGSIESLRPPVQRLQHAAPLKIITVLDGLM